MFLLEFNFILNYAPRLKNPTDAPLRHANFIPQEGNDILQANTKVLLTPLHTQKLFPVSDTLSSPAVQVSATTILTTDNSGLAEHYKATSCDDSEW